MFILHAWVVRQDQLVFQPLKRNLVVDTLFAWEMEIYQVVQLRTRIWIFGSPALVKGGHILNFEDGFVQIVKRWGYLDVWLDLLSRASDNARQVSHKHLLPHHPLKFGMELWVHQILISKYIELLFRHTWDTR